MKIPLVGFNINTKYALRTVKFLVMEKGSMVMINFMVVDASTHYNLILGRLWIHKMKVILYTYHQVIMEVLGDQEKAHSFYNMAMKQVELK